MSVIVTRFSNDESARPQSLLKQESTTNFKTAILKNTYERLLFYEKIVF